MKSPDIYTISYYTFEDVGRTTPPDYDWAISTSKRATLPEPRKMDVRSCDLWKWEHDHTICIVDEVFNEEESEKERIWREGHRD